MKRENQAISSKNLETSGLDPEITICKIVVLPLNYVPIKTEAYTKGSPGYASVIESGSYFGDIRTRSENNNMQNVLPLNYELMRGPGILGRMGESFESEQRRKRG
jgi:hypothetical protein